MIKYKLLDLIKLYTSWIQLTIVISILSCLTYLTIQQDIRMSANDPQIQMSEDLANELSNGKSPDTLLPTYKTDLLKSLSPFVIIYDEKGNLVASSAILFNNSLSLPEGLANDAKNKGELRYTWQPQDGIREAVVINHFSDKISGYVLVGRSLKETEIRENSLMLEVLSAWIIAVISTFIINILYYKIVDKK